MRVLLTEIPPTHADHYVQPRNVHKYSRRHVHPLHPCAAPWMVIAVRAVQKGPDPYTQSQALAACGMNIGSVFPTSFGGHTSGTPRLKGDRPDHAAAMFLAVPPIGLRISEGTCQALHLKTPKKNQFRAVQSCDMYTCAKRRNSSNPASRLVVSRSFGCLWHHHTFLVTTWGIRPRSSIAPEGQQSHLQIAGGVSPAPQEPQLAAHFHFQTPHRGHTKPHVSFFVMPTPVVPLD